ncbi:MAG TPA: hypothetical protein ENK02_07010 [Planctomycetes bacterium]|nr:hypothetical protein [Planctomycetota bacterium]
MIRILPFLLLVLGAFRGELFLLGRALGPGPDIVGLILCYAGLRLRPFTTLPVLFLLALLRSAYLPGGLLFHFWVLALVYLLLRPMGRFFVVERLPIQMGLALVASMGISALTALILWEGVLFLPARGVLGFAMTVALAPGVFPLLDFLLPLRLREAPRKVFAE